MDSKDITNMWKLYFQLENYFLSENIAIIRPVENWRYEWLLHRQLKFNIMRQIDGIEKSINLMVSC